MNECDCGACNGLTLCIAEHALYGPCCEGIGHEGRHCGFNGGAWTDDDPRSWQRCPHCGDDLSDSIVKHPPDTNDDGTPICLAERETEPSTEADHV